MFVVRARYGVLGAQSEGVFAADQPGSAKTRFAAPQRNTGEVRWIFIFFTYSIYWLAP